MVCQFIRLEFDETPGGEMLEMERIYAVDFRAYEVERRELWCDVFEDELMQQHQAGFVHRDVRRPSGLNGLHFDNVLLTHNGLRLIDIGISALRSQVSEKIFNKYIETELEEIKHFRQYLLDR